MSIFFPSHSVHAGMKRKQEESMIPPALLKKLKSMPSPFDLSEEDKIIAEKNREKIRQSEPAIRAAILSNGQRQLTRARESLLAYLRAREQEIRSGRSLPVRHVSTPIASHASNTKKRALSAEMLEMQQKLASSKPATFEERIQALESLFAKDKASFSSNFWMAVKPNPNPKQAVHVKLTLSKGPYFSKAIDESSLPISSEHYHIKAFESVGEGRKINTESPLLHLRVCKEHAEIVWLGKGEKLSGSDVIPLCILLRDHLNVDTFLYDDAKIYLPAEPKKKGKEERVKKSPAIWLRTSAVGDKDSLTWYQRALDLSVATCHHWKMIRHEEVDEKQAKESFIDQSPEKYQEALQHLRAFKISELYQFYPIYRGTAQNLTRLLSRAFNISERSLKGRIESLKKLPYTLQQIEALYTQRVKTASPAKKFQAAKDQHEIHKYLFSPMKIERMDQAEANFWKAVLEFSNTRVFVWQHK